MFDATSHQRTGRVEAVGLPEARTTTIERQPVSHLVTAKVEQNLLVDGVARRTEYTYDNVGHVLTTTQLAGTAGCGDDDVHVRADVLPACDRHRPRE
jgi:hypothetical protein